MEDKLRDMADRVENMCFAGSNKEKVLSELVDEIRAAVSLLRVSGNSWTGLVMLAHQPTQSPTSAPTIHDKLPPPAPKVFFGRSELVEMIVDLAERFMSIALTGTGGIGKTAIILTVLSDRRIRRQFGDSRSFIRCDRLIPSHMHFLRKLSEVTGAGVENPEDLSPLRSHLSSKEMIIVLDNAESILGLPETSAQEIHAIVDELSQFSNICLVITSRISNSLPAHCKIIEIPTLLMEAGHEMFYHIYKRSEQSDQISKILKELDFHPLSLTLLATLAQQNKWNAKRLTTEWERQRTRVLRTRNLGSLAATVELSLASPMFQELGPDAREVLEVVAFFPQGVNEDNVEGLFPTISDGLGMFDTFYNLSLTHRGDEFTTMLAPLRDYLRPRDPMASPFLRTAKEHYFGRLSIELDPGKPGFDKSKWIVSEDVNVEHLLDIFTSVNAESGDVWAACIHFMDHIFWHKTRLVVFGSKIEALPDTHPFKPICLMRLSRLFNSVGNPDERKRMLTHSLRLWREKGDDCQIADALINLADANLHMGFYKEGIQQAREASEVFGRFGDKPTQTNCLHVLASLLHQDGQLNAAEETASRTLELSDNPFDLCQCHRVLGNIHRSKGNTEKAIYHVETSLQVASPLGMDSLLSESHVSLAHLYMDQNKFNEARTHITRAKLHSGDDMLQLGRVSYNYAWLLCKQHRYEEGKSELLCAIAIFEELGATDFVEKCRQGLEMVE